MSPEQARGEGLDPRSDLFSLGSVLYQMTTGRPPFRASTTVAVLKRVCEDAPRPLADVLPDIPEWLEAVIFKLLRKQPDERYQTAQDVADLLARRQHHGLTRAIAAGGSIGNKDTRTVVSRSGSLPDLFSDSRRWLALSLVLAAAAVGVILYVPQLYSRQDAMSPRHDDNAAVSAIPALANDRTTDGGVGWHGWPEDAPRPAIAPFDADQARTHQEEWAQYLKLPVEYENSIGIKFRLIPPGEFMMGSTAEEIQSLLRQVPVGDKQWREGVRSEEPRHHVTLTHPVYLSVTEVTQGDHERITGSNPS